MKKLFFVWLTAFFYAIGPLSGQTFSSSLSPSPPADLPYEILPMDRGVFAISVDKVRREVHYFFSDEDFKIKNSGKFSLEDYSVSILPKVKDDKAYVIFNFLSTQNSQKILMIVDSNTGERSFIPINNYAMSDIDDFYILENSIAMVGLYNQNLNMVQFVNFKNSNQEPYTINLEMKIFDIVESDGYLDILASSQMGKTINKLQLITINEQGEKLYTIDADTGLGKNELIKSAYLQKTEDGSFRAVGIYSTSRKNHFSGYFHWDMDYSLNQAFVRHPATSLQGLSKGDNKKINRQIKYELTKGFSIVKVLEENGQLAIVSAPNMGYAYQKKYPRIYKNELFHVLYIGEDGIKLWDKTFALHRSLRSPYVNPGFIKNPPMYMINGNVYFLYHQEFTHSPSLIVHNINADIKYSADELSFTIPGTAQLYKTTKYKDNEIIVYGLKENWPVEQNFFFSKIPLY